MKDKQGKFNKTLKTFNKLAGALLLGFAVYFWHFRDLSLKRYEITRFPTNIENQAEEINKGGNKRERKSGRIYALLINGVPRGKEKDVIDFAKDLEDIRNCLIRNGIEYSQIFTLTTDATGSDNEFFDNRFLASKNNLLAAIEVIRKKVTENDVFFLYVTNHIYKSFLNFGESRFSLIGREISESELEKMLDRMNLRYSIMVFPQCYSGGFAERLGKGNNIALAKSRSNKLAYFSGEECFAKYFFPALFGNLKSKEREKADVNKDGRIFIDEAFKYSVEKDPCSNIRAFPFKNTPQMYYQNIYPSKISLDKVGNEF